MSDLLPFKKVPLPTRLERIRETLRHPSSLAVLASLGVHGLLWFGLPLLPSAASRQPNTQRQVDVIELSPLEQARLPQTALQPLPPSPDSPKLTDPFSSGVPAAPPDPTITTPVPGSSTYYPIPGLDPSSNRSTASTQTTQKPDPDSKPAKTQDGITNNQPQKQDGSDADTPKPDTPSNKAGDLKPTSGNQYEKNREDAEKQRLALQQKYAYNATGTSDQDYVANSGKAGNEVGETFEIKDWEKPISVRSPYPKDACKFQHDGKPIKGTTGLAVVLQPDGKLAEKTWLLKSSGFKGLDEAASNFLEQEWSQIAKQNEIEPGKKPKGFLVTVTAEPAEADCANVQKTS